MDPKAMKKDDLNREVKELRQRIINLEESSLRKDHIIQKYSLLANIIESSDDAIFSSTVNGTTVTWNKGAERIYGYTAQEVFGCDVSMFAPPDKKDEVAEITKKVTSGQPVSHFETIHLRKDGTPFHVSLVVSPILNATREIVGISTIARDITERKRAVDALHESEAKFRELFEHMHSGVAIYEAMNDGDDFIFVDFNTSAEEIDGISRKHLIGKSVREVFPGVEEFGLFEVFKRVYATGKSERHPVALYKDKRISRWRENYVYKLPSDKIVAVYEDVTERKQADEMLRRANAYNRSLLEASLDPLVTIGPDGTIRDVNTATELITGYTRKELINTDFSIYFTEPEKARIGYQEVFRVGSVRDYPLELRHLDGRVTSVLYNATVYRDEEGQIVGIFAAARDITMQKKAEEALREREENMRYIIKHDPNAIAVYDMNLNYIAASDRYLRDYNVKEDDIIGKHHYEVFPEMPQKWKDVHQRCLSGVIERNDDDFFERPDGSITYNRWECRPWYHTDGRMGGMITYTEVTTERKLAEMALKESEAKYRSIFENAVEGIFQSTPEGQLISVNPALAFTFGYKNPEDMMANVTDIGLQLYVDTEERTKYADLYHKNGVVRGLEARFFRKDGTVLWGSLNIREVNDSTDRILSYEGTFEDITSRKLAEEELRKTTEKLRATLGGTINALSLVVEMRDPYTSGHQKRVSDLARAMAQDMALPSDTIDNIRMAGTIHDIGKISVPAEILSKPGKLTDTELSLIKLHPQSGYDILRDAELPYPIAEIVFQHHERPDGSGYPQGLRDGQILFESQIIMVADVVEAMASDRPYRPALGIDAALEEIEKNKGVLYDTRVVDACLRLFREKGFGF
jgi:PAS domain S-box-containing protein